MKKNEEYIVDIIDNGFQGEGIAKIDGIPIFIDKAIKGEKVKIKILKVQKNFAYGKILEMIETSEFRYISDCENFKKCGGCSLRHMDYEYTLNHKKNVVQNCMNKIIKEKIVVKDVIGMENPIYYRNKLQYPLGVDVNGKAIMGVYSSRTHNIVPTSECKIQNKLCQKIANDVFEFLVTNNIDIYNEKSGTGTVRHIVIRIGVKTNEVLVTLVINDDKLKNKEAKFVKEITRKYPEIKTIVKNFNTEKTNVILGKKCEIIYGPRIYL